MVTQKVEKFKHLGSIIEERGDIDNDFDYHIRVGWQNGGMLLEYFVIRCKIEMGSLSYGSQTSCALWSCVLANQEESSSKLDGSRDNNDSVDVWI